MNIPQPCTIAAAAGAGVALITTARRIRTCRPDRPLRWQALQIAAHATLQATTAAILAWAGATHWPSAPETVLAALCTAAALLDLTNPADRALILAALRARLSALIEPPTDRKP